ncbi:MAG: hypothetical protein CVV21_01365 [Candidatus Goldiibacteriota bacterium HGW-Goldbacteria-1]|nr:MAG: hypothetical protein CVV21_01365 [Candidatus Goldiibacteriota bacterium HGW-Goldbacteria-1]
MKKEEINEMQIVTGVRKFLDAVFVLTDEKNGFNSNVLRLELRKNAVDMFKSILDGFESVDIAYKLQQAVKVRGLLIKAQFKLCESLEEGAVNRENFYTMLSMTKMLKNKLEFFRDNLEERNIFRGSRQFIL